MKYRKLGNTGIKVSEIGVGNTYLPNLPREVVVSIIHEAIKEGVNYFDIAANFHELNENLGFAFKGLTEELIITGHLGSGEDETGQYTIVRNLKECRKNFEEFLKLLKIEKVSILFVHNISEKEIEEIFGDGGLVDLAVTLKNEGFTDYIGLSTHDLNTGFKAIESRKIDVLMLPINLASHTRPGKSDFHKACVENDVGIVAMKPFAGGKLMQQNLTIYNLTANNYSGISPPTLKRMAQRKQPVSPIQCLNYILSQPGVATTVPGVKNVQELKENLHYLTATDEEKDYSSLLLDFQEYLSNQCVYCNHCLPCPSEIDVGHMNRLIDLALNEINNINKRGGNNEMIEEIQTISAVCTTCGTCSERCPFNVDVVVKINNFKQLYGFEMI
jgi:hypothetical protein